MNDKKQSFVLVAFEGAQMNVTANNIEIIIIFHLNKMPYNDNDIYLLHRLLLVLFHIRSILCKILIWPNPYSKFEQKQQFIARVS